MKNNFYGQHGEDFIIYKLLGEKSYGFYVEVGCIDGLRFSNSYFFEKNGWKGICIEAHNDYIPLIRRNRPESIVEHCAISDFDAEEIEFYANSRGSLSTLDKNQEENFRKKQPEYFEGFTIQKVPVRKLDTILSKYSPEKIDFISIDIEGHEINALKGINLKKFRPDIFIIECDSLENEKLINKLLKPHNYKLFCRHFNNLFYVQEYIFKNKKIQLLNGIHNIRLVHTVHPLDEKNNEKEAMHESYTLEIKKPLNVNFIILMQKYKILKKLIKKILEKIKTQIKRMVGLPIKKLYKKNDPIVIKTLNDKHFPYLISFPRTGSHWLRNIIELYFKKPLLLRSFYYGYKKDFLLYHTHDLIDDYNLDNVECQRCIYLYRDFPETVYSYLTYLHLDPFDDKNIEKITLLYAKHLKKWLIDKSIPEKLVIKYEELKKKPEKEFEKICKFFGTSIDVKKLNKILKRIDYKTVKKSTQDSGVVNLNQEYKSGRKEFIKLKSDFINSLIQKNYPELLRYF